MDSDSLAKHGFGAWYEFVSEPWDYGRERLCGEASRQAPAAPGVYAFRRCQRFARLNGDTDLIYIGHGYVLDRLMKYASLRYKVPDKATTETRLAEYSLSVALQVAWVAQPSKPDAKNLEGELLRLYAEEHLECPPFNRQGGPEG
jgi:hypothetical protein